MKSIRFVILLFVFLGGTTPLVAQLKVGSDGCVMVGNGIEDEPLSPP